jgi:hypothetical protein
VVHVVQYGSNVHRGELLVEEKIGTAATLPYRWVIE